MEFSLRDDPKSCIHTFSTSTHTRYLNVSLRPGVRIRNSVFCHSSRQDRCAGSLQKQGMDRLIPSLLPFAIGQEGTGHCSCMGVERTPAELHQLLGCTESFWTKTFLLRFCFSPLFCLFGMEGVCFLGTGLLPRCFLCSLSQPHGPDRGRALTVSMLPGTISRISSGILDRG